MADTFIYMFVMGSGFSLGVAVVVFLSWKVLQRSKNKKTKRKGGKMNGIV